MEATMFLVTSCAAHGTKETATYDGALMYVACASECVRDAALDPTGHAAWHAADGSDCWACCSAMILHSGTEVAR